MIQGNEIFKSHFVHVIIVIYVSNYNHVDVARKLDDALWVQQSIDQLDNFLIYFDVIES